MADQKVKIMQLTEGTPVDTDWIPFVDISDTTQSLEGSTKRALKSELKGIDGVGIANITLIGTVGLVKTYRITYTDATTYDYDVTDGSNGTNGTNGNGIVSITLISTVGLIKTYRILFTNTTTYDYTVIDGTNGTNGTSFVWKGTYSGATSYVVNDTVEYNGSSYICILASTGNIPTNATYFELMAQKGADGSGTGDMLSTNNLSDVANILTARTNLGLGNLATLDTVGTTEIDNDAVTFAKMQNITTNKILGRASAGNGDIEEIGIGSNLEISGSNLQAKTGTTAGTVATGDHTHTGVYEPVFTKNTAFNKDFGTTSGTVLEGNQLATKQDIETSTQKYTRDIICRVGTTANITLSGLLTIDGQVLVAGDYVLVKNQTTASQNGIYIVSATAWTRATEYSTTNDFNTKDIFITSGTVNTGTWYACYTKNPVIGTTSTVFSLMATTIGTTSDAAAAGNHTHTSLANLRLTTSVGIEGAMRYRYTNRTATATSSATDLVVNFTGSTASQVETMPSGVALSNNTGRVIYYKNDATVPWTIRQSASNTIDGSSADLTLLPGETLTCYNTALNTWITLQKGGVDLSSAQTLTNKRITKRVVTTTQSATPAINTNNGDIFNITGLAQAITSFTTNLTGTPVEGDLLMINITDNGTARAITWGASFEASTIALPTTTVISTLLKVGFQYNGVTSKWRCIATC